MRALFLVVFLAAGLLRGQVLTLDDCIRLAAEQNSQVLASQSGLSAAKAKRFQALSALLPSASATATYTRLNEAPYTVMSPAEIPFLPPDMEPIRIEMGKAEMEKVELQVKQPLALQLFSALALANTGVKQKELELRKARAQAALNAAKAYYALVQAKGFLRIAQTSKRQIEAHIKDLENMYAQGIVHKKDLLRAQVQASEVELLVLQAQNAVKLAQSSLCLAIGYPQDAEVEVAESLSFVDYPYPLDSVVAWAERHSLDAQLAAVGLEAAKKSVTLAAGALLPSFAAIFNYDYQKPNRELENEWYDSWTAVGVIQWDLFDWGGSVAALREAKAKKRQMEYLYKAALDGIRLQARAAYLAMDERRKKLSVARKELETAQENYRVTSDMFDAGAATNAELLDAHADLVRAKINLNSYLADYNTAVVELEYVTGQLERRVNDVLSRWEGPPKLEK